jgi:hypothetical protein
MTSALSRLGSVAACFVVGLAACDSATEPAEQLAVTLEFGVTRPAFFPPFSTVRTAGQMLIRGTIETLCQPTDGEATVRRDGVVLVLEVSAVASPDCMPATGNTGYDATITGIQSLQHVRVVHRWPGTEREDQVVWEAVYD